MASGRVSLVRPRAVAFDVIETLASLEPLRGRLGDVGQSGTLLEAWFLRTLRDGIALSATGEFHPFPAVARQALDAVTGHTLDEGDLDHVLGGFGELAPHSDVEPAMRRLADAGVRMGCLTNGTAPVTNGFLERSGLAGYVERVVTVEDVGTWKPAAAVYHAAADRFGLSPERMALVAAHAWDCHGARRAGCESVWISRFEGTYGDLFAPPDVQGRDLVEVADRVLELPEG